MKFQTSLMLLVISLAGSAYMASEIPVRAEDGVKIARRRKKKRRYKARLQRDVMMADELLIKRKYKEAADLYRSAISKNSKNIPAIVGLGMALAKQFKLDGAEEQFERALNLDPRNAMAHCGKAMVLMNRLQSSSMTIRRNRDSILKQAEEDCKQALDVDPGMPEAHYILGTVYKEQGRLDEAASEFQEAYKNDPRNPDAYAGLGMVRLKQGQLAGAEENFKRAIELHSGNSTAHYGLGKTYLMKGQLDDAIKELNTSLSLFPNSAPARLAIGEAYHNQGNDVAAVKEYQESIRIKPENPEAYLQIADIREARGDLEHSIAELHSGVELMPKNADLHLRIAEQSLRLEKLDDAMKEFKTTLELTPENVEAFKGLTRCYYLKAQKEATGAFVVSNEFEEADRMIDRAIQMNPNDMELRLAQAKLRALSGKQVDLSKIGTPTTDGERIAYAEALLAQNKFDEADRQMKMVIDNAATSKQAFAVADLALMIKDLDSAESGYNKAATFPGGEERAQRGLGLVAKAREEARQDLTLADDLARKKQLASAIDKYHAAIFENPKVSYARLGLAKTLERLRPRTPEDLREAIAQYKAHMALEKDMPEKIRQKLNKRIERLEVKAYKLEQKQKARKAKQKRTYGY